MNRQKPSSRAERRVLWEVRQRHKLGTPTDRKTPSRRAVTSTPATTSRQGSEPPRPPARRQSRPRKPGGSAHWIRRITILLLLVILLSGGVFGYKILAAGNKISSADRTLLGQLKDLLFSQGKGLQGETEGRINILLMAIGGEGHSGQNLADTIMVASIRPEDNQIALLSIPRDLYVQVPGEEYYSKINAVHAYGEAQGTDEGPEYLRRTVEEVTGLPMHYYGRVDFTAFKEIIDTVGGVDITIENSFLDYWHKIAFSAGTEQMDGERALAYVRARYIEGPEGGDFKRAARQQQVLLALRDKVFSVNTALDFTALNSILNSLSDNIRTDMHLWEMKRLYELARQIDSSSVHSVVLSTGPRGVLVGTTEVLGGTPASVLKTKTGDYSEIHTVAANAFSAEVARHSADASAAAPAPLTPDEVTAAAAEQAADEEIPQPTLEIRNGTNVAGLAKQTSDDLSAKEYEVLTIGNAATRTVETTTVYALTDDATDGAVAVAELIGAVADSGLPEGEAASDADVLIILGTDAS